MDTGKCNDIYSAFEPVRPRAIRWFAFHAAWPWLDRSKNDTHLVLVTPLSTRKRIFVEHLRFAIRHSRFSDQVALRFTLCRLKVYRGERFG